MQQAAGGSHFSPAKGIASCHCMASNDILAFYIRFEALNSI